MINIFSLLNRYCLQQLFIRGIIYIFFIFCFASCKTIKPPSSYFQTILHDTTISGFVKNDFESKIKTGDQLDIRVTSLSIVEDELFNKAAAVSNSPGVSGYTVYPDGAVLLHRLGRVAVAGLTRRELAAKLENDLQPYMKEPIVNVIYLNHKITIIGEVGGPQVLAMPEEKLPLLDVLIKSGDIKENGLRNKVMIIRDSGNDKTVKHVNLEDHSIFNSPWYYVQPNDIIYVLADNTEKIKEEKKRKVQGVFAAAASGLTFVFLVLDRVFR